MNLVPPSGGARKIIIGAKAPSHWSLNVPQLCAVDFYVQRSTEEQDACAVENYMGENGLAAEEEYKWGHYTCGASELSPSPPRCLHRTS